MNRSNDYFLFIDESGKSKISDEGQYFLLSGLIINRDLHAALSNYMVSLKDKSHIPTGENIHAFNLFENEETDGKRIRYSYIDTFFERLMSLIQGTEMKCLIVRVDKMPFKNLVVRTADKFNVSSRTITNYLKKIDLHDFLYEALARRLILEFGHFLEFENAQGEIMAESRRHDNLAVLRAFLAATDKSKFEERTNYRLWAENSLKRIHSLTFQNKKGLSFGLEIADLFGWAHFNKVYGIVRPISSRAKKRRVESRIEKVDEIMSGCYKKKAEDITRFKLNTVAKDRVSEFTEILKQYKQSQSLQGPH